ncbi:MAG: hypothetical protein ABEJ69_02865 [Candidatus Nanohaloarchaea archaeon]
MEKVDANCRDFEAELEPDREEELSNTVRVIDDGRLMLDSRVLRV